MKTRLTILCENTVRPLEGLIGEHGFACYLETAKGNYLFDTGQGLGIGGNARILEKDLAQIRAVVLSHGHWDHTGGLPEVLRQTGPVDVWGHPAMFKARYHSKDSEQRYIGVPHRRDYLEALGARFRLENRWREIGPGVYLTGEIPRRTPFEKGDPHMHLADQEGSARQPDPLEDDLSLVVESDKGLILVLGCAHAGLVNILRHVQEQTGRQEIYAIIGGTHLGFADDAQFAQTLAALEDFRVKKLGVSHCTGLPRAAALAARLGERFFFGSAGAVLEG
ncbi:MBL fold metallo-hydrolase [Desulfuromonas versatilis]|uniref:MBL fold metallo-hydrolase n=1 Tax=Desulfuromonas versatilis TaxID=2802975 RepID=A0ABM8HQP1_9BACT|nr:MBL fold metallo-hydrolase [Desulfuromonas versatilis]BCR04151.1 MBL fold metallo-hydrolase [Desulfuromonas versatilis]